MIIILAIAAILALPAGFTLGYHMAKIRWYYRGLYDACVTGGQNTTPRICLGAVRVAFNNKWHKEPSPGWHWPLPEITTQEEE